MIMQNRVFSLYYVVKNKPGECLMVKKIMNEMIFPDIRSQYIRVKHVVRILKITEFDTCWVCMDEYFFLLGAAKLVSFDSV